MKDKLLAAIRANCAEFEAAGDLSEELRTLPPDAVETLRGMGAFWLKTLAELGGTPSIRRTSATSSRNSRTSTRRRPGPR